MRRAPPSQSAPLLHLLQARVAERKQRQQQLQRTSSPAAALARLTAGPPGTIMSLLCFI